MGLSIRAYARHRGVTDTAVHKAIRSGRITPEPDGTLDPEKADAEWALNTQDQEPGTRVGSSRVPMTLEGQPEAGGTSLLQARTINEVLKARLKQVELAQRKDELVDRAQAIAHVFKLARAERDAWLNWPARIAAPLAAELGVDTHTLTIALEARVREHLQELGELRPRVDG